MNMVDFEKGINIEKAEQTDFFDPATQNKFNTPGQVKKLWLTKYAPDKYRKAVTFEANTCRTRVLALLTVWDCIQKFDPELSDVL